MKSIFNKETESEIINRIKTLSPENKALWGKMNVYQMVKHCTLCEDMYLGTLPIKRVFIGKLIGGMMLKKVLKDDQPFSKGSPTSKLLTSQEKIGDLEELKSEWISRIKQYENYKEQNFVHPFFGPMTKEQIGYLDYKHIDHHLRQFGA